jgi:protein TonB
MRTWNPGLQGLGRTAFVAAVTLAGGMLVFGALAALNVPRIRRAEKERLAVVSFSVPTATQSQRQRRREILPPIQRRSRRAEPTLSLLPNLGAESSRIRVEMPELEDPLGGQLSDTLLGNLREVALTEDTVDTKPVLLAGQVAYPDRARQRQLQGKVVVSLLIGADGRVRTLKILESVPPGVFEEAVQQSVPGWTFQPAEYRGQPVQVWVTIPIPFRMD